VPYIRPTGGPRPGGRVRAGSALRVELFFDEEAGNWHYRVPALHINGGGTSTREDAERECPSAITFALEGDPHDYDTAPKPSPST
jgi:hypothetical protein